MSYPYMIQDITRDPPRLAHQDILVEERAKVDHVVDGLSRCRRIMEIEHIGIEI